MAISILHVGLPLEHPLIPVEDRAKIRARLDALQRGMRAAGYEYEILCVAPDGGMEEFKAELRARGCDGVVLGGGVVGNHGAACGRGACGDSEGEDYVSQSCGGSEYYGGAMVPCSAELGRRGACRSRLAMVE